jgi:hypothetical protein
LAKKVVLKSTPFDLPILLLALSYLLSLFIASSNKIEAMMITGGTGTILGLTLFYFLITNNVRTEEEPGGQKRNLSSPFISAFLASAVVLSLLAIYQLAGVSEAIVPAGKGLDWLRAKTWTPVGSLVSLAAFLTVSLALAIGALIQQVREPAALNEPTALAERPTKDLVSFLFSLIFVVLIVLGLGTSLYQLMTSAKPILLSQSAGWVIAIEAFKHFPLFGVGVDNFLSAFTQGRPLELNSSQFWSSRFALSSNFYFHLLTTVGILGLGAWLLLFSRVIKIFSIQKMNGQKWQQEFTYLLLPLFIIFLLLVVLPATFLILFAFYLLLGLLGAGRLSGKIEEESRILPQMIFIVILLLVGGSLYGICRVFAAEHFFKQSLDAAAANQATDTYNLHIKAIQTNPYRVNYRLSYSQINLALASDILSNPPAGGLTDQERQNVSQLIQQAIREAKVGVSLAPTNVIAWENLAGLYRSLINFAQDADSWTISALQQAISLDPTNPLLRLDSGGVYYSLKNYDEASRQFMAAVNLKPDLANAYYNLASAYREKGMIKEAVRAMEKTQSLVTIDSNDYKKVTEELTDLRAQLPKEETVATPSGAPETLTPPATAAAGLKPPLTLPEEAEPAISPLPTSSPLPSPSPTASPSPLQ